MHHAHIIKTLGLPQLIIEKRAPLKDCALALRCRTKTKDAVCDRCGQLSSTVHAREKIVVRDETFRRGVVKLEIVKKRFRCGRCGHTFNEFLSGIRKGARTTDRFGREIAEAGANFQCQKRVCEVFEVSSTFVAAMTKRFQIRKIAERQRLWPKRLGVDEHSFKRDPKTGGVEFVTIFVSHSNGGLFEVMEGRAYEVLAPCAKAIAGREQVELITLDLSGGYREAMRLLFPNAMLVADKFHVVRLFGKYLREVRLRDLGKRGRREDRRVAVVHMPRSELSREQRNTLEIVKLDFPELGLAYDLRLEIQAIYRLRDRHAAKTRYDAMTDRLGRIPKSELATTLRSTLMSWRTEILAYFYHRLTNARCEGHNTKAKLVKRRAYGFKSFENYRRAQLVA